MYCSAQKVGKKGDGGKNTHRKQWEQETNSPCLAQSRGITAVLTPLRSVLSPPPPFCNGRQKRPISVWDHAFLITAFPHQPFSVSKFNLILPSNNPLCYQSNYNTTNEVPGFGEQKNRNQQMLTPIFKDKSNRACCKLLQPGRTSCTARSRASTGRISPYLPSV